MTTGITGACGAMRWRCGAEPLFADHCQCRACQRQTGTGHSSHMGVPAAAVTIAGDVREYRTHADSGNDSVRGFCPICGSPLLFRSSGWPDMLFLAAGSLDDPSRFQPQMVVFTAKAPPWDRVDPALPSFPGMPPAED